jgi:hypothetical protein
MEWQRLEQLKEKVQHDDDFGAIWKFFFDHLGENERFVRSGQLAGPEMTDLLEPIIESVCKRIVNDEVMIAQTLLTEVPGQHFYHGPCVTDAGLCVVLYFDDLKMGMISFTRGIGTGWVHYARFTTIPVLDRHAVIVQGKNETGH